MSTVTEWDNDTYHGMPAIGRGYSSNVNFSIYKEAQYKCVELQD